MFDLDLFIMSIVTYEGRSDFLNSTLPLLLPYASQCPLELLQAARTTVNIIPINVKANTFFMSSDLNS